MTAEKTPTSGGAALSSPSGRPSTAKKAPKQLNYRGKISALDARAGTLSVSGSAGEKRFMVQDAAKDAVERLAVGDNVRISYTEKNGKLTAISIRRTKASRAKTQRIQTKPNPSTVPARKPAGKP
jgi:hypothetical protein